MSIKCVVVLEDGYVCLQCTGYCTLEAVKDLYSSAVNAALEHGSSHVLIDAIEVKGDLTLLERYESSEYLAREILRRAPGKIKKIAVCSMEPPLDPQRFGEIVAKNRGINAKATTDMDEAVAWLDQPSFPPFE